MKKWTKINICDRLFLLIWKILYWGIQVFIFIDKNCGKLGLLLKRNNPYLYLVLKKMKRPVDLFWPKDAKYLSTYLDVFTKLIPYFTIVHGHKMILNNPGDFLSLSLYLDGVFEPFETEIVKKEIKRGDTFLDIGANVGYYTLLAAKLVGKSGKVYAFEPDPHNFSILKKNVSLNGYNNVVLTNKAVSDYTGRTRLFLSEDNGGHHRICSSPEERKSIFVDTVTLDDFFKQKKVQINFIKMDIEGAEGRALEGMTQLLKKNRKVYLLTEFCPEVLELHGSSAKKYLNQLELLGFKLYYIQKGGREAVIKDKLLKVYINEKNRYTNLLGIKS